MSRLLFFPFFFSQSPSPHTSFNASEGGITLQCGEL